MHIVWVPWWRQQKQQQRHIITQRWSEPIKNCTTEQLTHNWYWMESTRLSVNSDHQVWFTLCVEQMATFLRRFLSLFSLSDFPGNWLIHSILLLLSTHSIIPTYSFHFISFGRSFAEILYKQGESFGFQWKSVCVCTCELLYRIFGHHFLYRKWRVCQKTKFVVSRSGSRLNHIIKSFLPNAHKPSV